MAVNAYALTSVAILEAALRDADAQAIRIHHDQSVSATAATAEVTSTALILIITGGANAGTTTLTLSDAANDTLGELVTVINALAKGWVAALAPAASPSGYSTDLAIFAQTSAFGQTNRQTLLNLDRYLMELSIDAASGWLETYTGWQYVSREYREWYDGTGDQTLVLRHRPVTELARVCVGRENALKISNTSTSHSAASVSVTSTLVSLRRTNSAGTVSTTTVTFAAQATVTLMAAAINALGDGWSATVQGSTGVQASADLAVSPYLYCLGQDVMLEVPDTPVGELRTDDPAGIVWLGTIRDASWDEWGTFWTGRRNVFIQYTAGYAETDLAFQPIRQLATEVAAVLFTKAREDPTVQSEKLGDYSYTRAALGGALSAFEARADLFVRRDWIAAA